MMNFLTGVSEEDKNAIVGIHNQERREVTPAATNMMLMVSI